MATVLSLDEGVNGTVPKLRVSPGHDGSGDGVQQDGRGGESHDGEAVCRTAHDDDDGKEKKRSGQWLAVAGSARTNGADLRHCCDIRIVD